MSELSYISEGFIRYPYNYILVCTLHFLGVCVCDANKRQTKLPNVI